MTQGELASTSLLAFAKYPDGTLRDGITYHCIPRSEVDAAMKIGWLPVLPHVGVREGIPFALFAWVCGCKMVVPV